MHHSNVVTEFSTMRRVMNEGWSSNLTERERETEYVYIYIYVYSLERCFLLETPSIPPRILSSIVPRSRSR